MTRSSGSRRGGVRAENGGVNQAGSISEYVNVASRGTLRQGEGGCRYLQGVSVMHILTSKAVMLSQCDRSVA